MVIMKELILLFEIITIHWMMMGVKELFISKQMIKIDIMVIHLV